MLPGTTVSPTVDASRTISEPTPTSFMSLLISAAPLQLSAGGDVKIAVSSMYSQLPVNARFDTTHASVTSEAPAWLMIITGSRSARPDDSPKRSGVTSSGTTARTSPSPVT